MKLLTRTIAMTCIAALLLSSGCAVANPFGMASSAATAPALPAINIAYSTPTDRLNVLAGAPSANQFVSAGQPMPSMLPSVTESTLEVNYPHPQGRANLAQVVLRVGTEGAPDAETWLLDIPAWQVEGIMQRLRDENFFRRAKALESEVDMSVTQDGDNFRKRFRAVPELDALVLRTFREGRPLHLAQNEPSQFTSMQHAPAQHWPISQQAPTTYR